MADRISITALKVPSESEALKELLQEYTDGVRQALIACGLLDADSEQAKSLNEEYISSLYGPPNGCTLVAMTDDKPAGCAMLRPLKGNVCEMKRLFVREAFRGEGIGWALVEALLTQASEMGYGRMRLSTHTFMNPALKLYEQFGFDVIDDYHHDPLQGTVCLERDLSDYE